MAEMLDSSPPICAWKLTVSVKSISFNLKTDNATQAVEEIVVAPLFAVCFD